MDMSTIDPQIQKNIRMAEYVCNYIAAYFKCYGLNLELNDGDPFELDSAPFETLANSMGQVKLTIMYGAIKCGLSRYIIEDTIMSSIKPITRKQNEMDDGQDDDLDLDGTNKLFNQQWIEIEPEWNGRLLAYFLQIWSMSIVYIYWANREKKLTVAILDDCSDQSSRFCGTHSKIGFAVKGDTELTEMFLDNEPTLSNQSTQSSDSTQLSYSTPSTQSTDEDIKIKFNKTPYSSPKIDRAIILARHLIGVNFGTIDEIISETVNYINEFFTKDEKFEKDELKKLSKIIEKALYVHMPKDEADFIRYGPEKILYFEDNLLESWSLNVPEKIRTKINKLASIGIYPIYPSTDDTWDEDNPIYVQARSLILAPSKEKKTNKMDVGGSKRTRKSNRTRKKKPKRKTKKR